MARPKDAARIRGQKKYRDLKEQGLTDSEIQQELNPDEAAPPPDTEDTTSEEE